MAVRHVGIVNESRAVDRLAHRKNAHTERVACLRFKRKETLLSDSVRVRTCVRLLTAFGNSRYYVW